MIFWQMVVFSATSQGLNLLQGRAEEPRSQVPVYRVRLTTLSPDICPARGPDCH